MSQRKYSLVRHVLLSVVSLGWSPLLRAAEAPRPNFVIINIDDLGYGEIGPFGSKNATLHLDRMAAEGRKMMSHYGAPVCSPSRAALMTGSYPKRAMPVPHVLFPVSEIGLHPNEQTVAEVLKDAGYATAHIGKWHLGDQPMFLPTRQGFDAFFGIPYSNDMGPAAEGAKRNRGAPPIQPKKKTAPAAAPKTRSPEEMETGLRENQPPLPLLENETVVGRVRAEEQVELTRQFTERAVNFIREKRERPFFLYLAHSAVHFPVYPRDNFLGKSGRGLLGDWIQEVDWSVGQVLNALRDLGLDKNTLVIFTSDNGGPVAQGATNTPLRGSKNSTWEGGVRVSTLAWWPGRIPAGTATAAITTMMDILPTFARLAGARPPADRVIDGVDVWPVLTGEPARVPRDSFHYFRGLDLEAVRAGPWKLHLASGELYNLERDIGEAANVAETESEVVKRLRAMAQAMHADLGMSGVGPGCRLPGRAPDPQPILSGDGTVRKELVGLRERF